MDDINDIKELVARALDRKNVLSRLRAELRAHVFLAIDEEETGAGGEGLGKRTGSSQRDTFTKTSEGQLVVDLVHEFLEWCSMEFTLKVFEPEIGQSFVSSKRSDLSHQLGLTVTSDAPLLLSVLRGTQSKGSDLAPSGTGISQAVVPPLNLSRELQQSEPEKGNSVPTLRQLPPVLSKLQPLKPDEASPSPPLPPKAPPPPRVPPPAPPAPKKEASGTGEDSYGDIESDEGLEGIEIVDEEEDYAFVMADKAPDRGPGSAAPPTQQDIARRLSGDGGGAGDSQDMSESGLSSTSVIMPGGRIRPGRLSSGAGKPAGAESTGQNQKNNSSQNLTQGDRSFGSSHEMGGVSYGAEPENSLTLTGDLTRSPDKLSPGSLAGSRDDFPKPRGLASLAPLTIKGLAPLGPVGTLGRPLKTSAGDIKEELRKAGLLTLPPGDSDYSAASSLDVTRSQQHQLLHQGGAAAKPSGGRIVYDAEFSVSNSMLEDVLGNQPDRDHAESAGMSFDLRQSMDLREHGLSQTDRSGDLDLDTADIAETAEWD